MILPEDMKHIEPRFSAAGLTAKLVEADDPDAEDDQIEIFSGGIDTGITIQIALIGGGYFVNEHRGEGASFVLIPRGEFRSLKKAIERAIEVVKAKQEVA